MAIQTPTEKGFTSRPGADYPGCLLHAHQNDCADCWRALLEEAQGRRSLKPAENLKEDVSGLFNAKFEQKMQENTPGQS